MNYDKYVMVDGFGRDIDEDLYWRNTGLSQTSIAEIKEYHRTHPVQADGTRLKDEEQRPDYTVHDIDPKDDVKKNYRRASEKG